MKKLASLLGLALALGAPMIASAAPGDYGVVRGRIQSSAPYSVDLRRGPHVTLRNGTVIEPRGTTLRPGMRIVARGRYQDGRHNFVADRVDVVREREGRRGDRYGDDMRRDGFYSR